MLHSLGSANSDQVRGKATLEITCVERFLFILASAPLFIWNEQGQTGAMWVAVHIAPLARGRTFEVVDWHASQSQGDPDSRRPRRCDQKQMRSSSSSTAAVALHDATKRAW